MPGIKGYRPSRKTRELHEKRTTPEAIRVWEQVEAARKPNVRSEAQVVLGQQLAAEIDAWRQAWLKTRTPERGNVLMGPLDWLRAETGINARQIHNYANNKRKFVPFSDAEKILMAIDREYLLGGTIHVIPNPAWSIDRWIEYMEERGCI